MEARERDGLRRKVLEAFREQGFVPEVFESPMPGENKDHLRRLHARAVAYLRDKARPHLAAKEPKLLGYIGSGRRIDPFRIRPVLLRVQRRSFEELLFRYARLHWSIPVSSGYGRRLRFLVWDGHHDKLIGLIGLSDPVFALRPRDRWVGWDAETKRHRLKSVMDAFVLGAVPPYAQMLGGKLVALAVWSSEVRQAFKERYGNRPTRILGERALDLAMITTTSALGRSSLYNRVRYRGHLVYQPVGYTQGTGDLPFLNGLYQDLAELVRRHARPTAKRAEWGQGYRNRREVITKALKLLDLPEGLRVHGVKREVYVVPMGPDARAFLRGEQPHFTPYEYSFEELAGYALERWVWPRARRDMRYRSFDPETWRLWGRS